MVVVENQFPARYEALEQLGKGGGGEVWSARDRITDEVVALKLLREGAAEPEMLALVREATLLSGLEGLGVPRVLQFGRLAGDGRAYMVRELVEGTSLQDLAESGSDQEPERLLGAVVEAADMLTRLHRALLLHGDMKPANIIVQVDGSATLVDLGLAAPWIEGGARPEGLTPRYAAPELFRGEPLTPRCEVFALGATLSEVLSCIGSGASSEVREAVNAVAMRATDADAHKRYPSVDEFAEALRSAANLPLQPRVGKARVWVISGMDEPCGELLERIRELPPGGGLVVSGAPGSGRSTLICRAAWSLGVADIPAKLLQRSETTDLEQALEVVLDGSNVAQTVLIVDDADQYETAELAQLDALRRQGCRLVMVVSGEAESTPLPGETFGLFQLLPLDKANAVELVKRMIPSLSENLIEHIVARTGGFPGPLRTLVEQLEGQAVVSVDDVDRCIDEVPIPLGVRVDPEEIHRLLDRGRFDQAADCLRAYEVEASVPVALARAKLLTGTGEHKAALAELERVRFCLDEPDDEQAAVWHLQTARANLRGGDYEASEFHANIALTQLGTSMLGDIGQSQAASHEPKLRALGADALAVWGLSQSLSGRHDEATITLRRSVELARSLDDERILAVALGSLGFALQRNDRLDQAKEAHEEALDMAERAGDAGHVATTRVNLAGIAKTQGDVGSALVHLEAAVDMGRRSGRRSTTWQALLNLANLDLFLGRLARAQMSIDALVAERGSLSLAFQAQLLALEAEHAALSGDVDSAEQACRQCAEAYEKLGRRLDAGEALIERVLIMVRGQPVPDIPALRSDLDDVEELLADTTAHRAQYLLARGRVAKLAGELSEAREAYDAAIETAKKNGQREWVWRTLEARAQLAAREGDEEGATEGLRAALKVLEAIAIELPRDLREVYWSDSRRRKLRLGEDHTKPAQALPILSPGHTVVTDVDGPTEYVDGAPSDRLTRVLEINRQIAGEYDLDRLLERVTDNAIAMLFAERGFVLLRSRSGEDKLSVHAARDSQGRDPHERFSHSIARRTVDSSEPFVSVDALSDQRVSDYVSVHSLMLKSVACVPIRSRSRGTIGALYLETRMRKGVNFREELPTLMAFADQVAIAIETARLVNENQQRTRELEASNIELEAARSKLEELLGQRTEQLESTRKSLKSARAALSGHFGYPGIVGTSDAMRRVYAVVERVKDANVPLLLVGESGTGKEVIARAVHSSGVRTKKKMVGINCGAIPENLLESELFGHVRGAFTGADRDKKGLFRDVEGGTILLDEIGEMPAKMQAGLLRVLQEKTVRPVGGTVEEAVDVRVIAATHRSLADMVAAGTFREDLYYRLNVIEIRVPPLRERPADIPLLVDHFLRVFAARHSRDKRNLSRDAIKLLMEYAWPGNVRQLENVLLNAWILSDAEELVADDFDLPSARAGGSRGQALSQPPLRPGTSGEKQSQEREQILEALTKSNWNRAQAAQLLGMPRRTFYRRLKKYGIQ